MRSLSAETTFVVALYYSYKKPSDIKRTQLSIDLLFYSVGGYRRSRVEEIEVDGGESAAAACAKLAGKERLAAMAAGTPPHARFTVLSSILTLIVSATLYNTL